MSTFLDIMLRPEVPNAQKELLRTKVKIKRLSELTGTDAVLELQGLPYGKVQEIKDSSTDKEVMILLAGCPELRDPTLQDKFGGATPAETVKAMFLPGEIADLSAAVERLSGYRKNTIEEIKNF